MAQVAQLHLAHLLRVGGRDKDALALLGSALESLPGGALLPFHELLSHQGPWLREQLLVRSAPEAAALLALLPEAQAPAASEAPLAGGDALSTRELAVLQLIAQGCSNQEISERLFISLHTVKTHARHINGKLGVERRTQAVARAKALGLLR